MGDLVLARNCCLARMLPGEAENGVGMNRSVRGAQSVKRSEQSNGLDTALPLPFFYIHNMHTSYSYARILRGLHVHPNTTRTLSTNTHTRTHSHTIRLSEG